MYGAEERLSNLCCDLSLGIYRESFELEGGTREDIGHGQILRMR